MTDKERLEIVAYLEKMTKLATRLAEKENVRAGNFYFGCANTYSDIAWLLKHWPMTKDVIEKGDWPHQPEREVCEK